MDHYLEIQVLPDLDISAPALMNNLFAKFHRVVAQRGCGEVGVSFPNYDKTLGNLLRLHGTQSSLSHLMSETWLKGLRDYTKVSEVLAVPSEIKGFRCIGRIQQKSPQNMRKRSINKGWKTNEEALEILPDSKQKLLDLPYLQIQSLSSKQQMRIYIKQGKLQKTASAGTFSSYGLSRITSVPYF